jgi:hypothetical protein
LGLLFLLVGTDGGATEATDGTPDEGSGTAVTVTGDQGAGSGSDGGATDGAFLGGSASDEGEGRGEKQCDQGVALHGREVSLFLTKISSGDFMTFLFGGERRTGGFPG